MLLRSLETLNQVFSISQKWDLPGSSTKPFNCQDEPASQISRSKVILLQKLLYGHTDTHAGYSIWTTKVVGNNEHLFIIRYDTISDI